MLLQVSALAAGYGNKTVITDVSFALEPGQIIALLGHNGAGKSVTLKTVMGLLPPRAGDVRFDGRAIEALPVAERVAIGLRMLPAGRGVFHDLRVVENIDVVAAYNCGPDALFTPADVYRLFPILDERRSQRAGTLSGGPAAAARARAGDPRQAALHPARRAFDRAAPDLVERLFAQIREVCKSHAITAILVEQNVAAAMKVADHVIIMNNGRIVFDGPPEKARGSNFWSYF